MGKKCRGLRAKWSSAVMEEALNLLEEGKSQRYVESYCGIPRRTLRNHLKTGVSERKLGRKKLLLTKNAVPVKSGRGCADDIVPASPEKTINNSASNSGGLQSDKMHARKCPTSSADLRTSSLNANIKATSRQRICRTCLRTSDVEENAFYHINSTTSSESNMSNTIKQKFAECVPEVDFEITADAQICGYCTAALHWSYEFRKNCLKTEKMICNFVREVGGDIYKVNLEKLLRWINLKTLQKLKSVEIVSDIARSPNSTKYWYNIG